MKMVGQNTTVLKRIDAIAYFIKPAYDLAISPLDNVPHNPGFETCIGT